MKINKKSRLKELSFNWVVIFAMAMSFANASTIRASDETDSQGVVDSALVTLKDFIGDDTLTWFNENLENTKALLIFPKLSKAGKDVGGSEGIGILVVRNKKTGDWSQPAFYNIRSASIGPQIGTDSAQAIFMIMRRSTVNSLYYSSLKLGRDSSYAVGPVGEGAREHINADIISFAKSNGLYSGLNLSGAVLDVGEEWNKAYYNKKISPEEIIVKGSASNRGSDDLLLTLKDMF